uniref:Uncharacterized protein n=1 Tax=Aegilops tauschii subsp. strangulata TaxID=200361 RepID=A0A452XX07_AEGTS
MAVSDKAVRPCSSSSSGLDPLLKDLTEKKLIFRRNVASLASELKDVRHKLASQEQLFTRESQTREVAETKARSMEEEVSKLQKCLLDKDEQLNATRGITEHVRSSLHSPFGVAFPFFLNSPFLFHDELVKFVF